MTLVPPRRLVFKQFIRADNLNPMQGSGRRRCPPLEAIDRAPQDRLFDVQPQNQLGENHGDSRNAADDSLLLHCGFDFEPVLRPAPEYRLSFRFAMVPSIPRFRAARKNSV